MLCNNNNILVLTFIIQVIYFNRVIAISIKVVSNLFLLDRKTRRQVDTRQEYGADVFTLRTQDRGRRTEDGGRWAVNGTGGRSTVDGGRWT